MKYKIIICLSIIAILFFIIYLFKDDLKTLKDKTKSVPETFKKYKKLSEASNSEFKVTFLHDIKMNGLSDDYNLFKLKNGYFLLKLNESKYPDFQTTFYKINEDGTIVNSYKIPNELKFFNGYLLGKGIYCNWIIDNDEKVLKSKFNKTKITKDKFEGLSKQATILYALSYDEFMMKIENEWIYTQTDFKEYSNNNKINAEVNLLQTNINNLPKDLTLNSYSSLSNGFTHFPSSLDDFEFSFFEKIKFKKGGNSQSIGSSTGGNSWLTTWTGNGYFTLKFKNKNFDFKYPILFIQDNSNWKYSIPFSIFKTDQFALIGTIKEVYLIQSL